MIAPEHANSLATKLIHWLETGTFPEGLFTADVFFDVSVPQWRVQTQGVEESVGLRQQMHPFPGRVPRWRCDPTPTGFIIEFEESWHDQGEDWYSREMARADVRGCDRRHSSR